MVIAIYGSRSQDSYIRELRDLLRGLTERHTVSLHPKLGWYLQEHGVPLLNAGISERIPRDATLVMSIGGDGTFLRAARWVGDMEVPILGVNTGHLGFLASCRLPDAMDMVDAFGRGDVEIERRMLLHVESAALPDGEWPYALNEVALQKEDTASMITVSARINGQQLANYRADGLIVSTPTGSTAYNLAAGGPVVEPTIDCMVITPVAPHTLTLRPLVAGGDSELELRVEGRPKDYRLSLDSRSYVVGRGTEVRIRRGEFSLRLVRRREKGFAVVLSEKLLWGN